MESTCKRGTLVLPLTALCLFVAVGLASADDYIYAKCIMKSLGFPGLNVSGEIMLMQSTSTNVTTLSGHLTGFTNGTRGNHGFHVHENGSTDGNCSAAGLHYNPFNKTHGGPNDTLRHVGDLGNIMVEPSLDSHVQINDSVISLRGNYSIVNRSLVVHVGEDDLGKGNSSDSLSTGHSGYRIGCCVITLDPRGNTSDSTTRTTASGPVNPTTVATATSMGPCGFLLVFTAGLLLLFKCI